MGLLKVIQDKPGFAKIGIQGAQGSGKTRTAVELAVTIHRLFNSRKPVTFFDTETGSDYVSQLILERTGHQPLGIKTRAFSDLLTVVQECTDGASDILIIDSITHVWRELGSAYMARANERRRYAKTRMEIGDIMQVKELWAPWPDLFLNSPLHIIVCGREGSAWGHEENEETGKRELVQTGTKMRVEGEFGHEPSLVIGMTAIQMPGSVVRTRDGRRERRPTAITNVATVLKDRFDTMNGAVIEFPTGDSFLPFLQLLNPTAHRPVDTSIKSGSILPEMTEEGRFRDRQERTITLEEIQGEIAKYFPGQSVAEKKAKAGLLERVFSTRSWTKVEGMDLAQLNAGLMDLRRAIAGMRETEDGIGRGAGGVVGGSSTSFTEGTSGRIGTESDEPSIIAVGVREPGDEG